MSTTQITPAIMLEFLKKYGYSFATEKGCEIILKTWEQNKARLLEKFRKHPNWDEESLAIVFKNEYERDFDATAFEPFIAWVREQVDKMVSNTGYYDAKYKRIESSYTDYIGYVEGAREKIKNLENLGVKLDLLPDLGVNEVRLKRNLVRNYRRKMLDGRESWYSDYDDNYYYIPRDLRMKINQAFDALAYIQNNCKSQFVSAEQAEAIRELCPVKVNEGLKLTKAIQKICMTLGLHEIKEIRVAHENTDRLKDFGFNYHFMALADRINPVTYKRITCISLNPLDYWGMSFGYKWASCHTIDKQNIRGVPDHHYSGCYSSGTESYMLDSSSIIFYVIREDYDGKLYWEEDKMQRVVFCVNENGSMLLESRVYPDGRAAESETGIAVQFRNAMQKVIADVFDVNNYWRVEKGSRVCADNSETFGTHFDDYRRYPDVNMSFNKDECMEFPRIRIGHDPICPCCGSEHHFEENIMCRDCLDENDNRHVCEHCGDFIDPDDEIIADDGTYFCCDICAVNHDYRMCYDDDRYHYYEDLYWCEDDDNYHDEDHCYRDDYNDNYYSGDPYIETIDGNTYHSEENAWDDGYEQEYFSDEWMRRDRLQYDEFESGYFDPNHDNAISTEDGNHFISEESAEDSGYVETVSHVWMKEDDAIEIDGDYYKDEDEARENGFVLNSEDEWVLEEREVSA